MVTKARSFVPNQIFVGLPWKTIRPKYERLIAELAKRFPLYLTIVGRNDGQSAEVLFEIIKQRISSSSHAIFDATGGNANVSLEYGYAEGIDVPRTIFLSSHRASQRTGAGDPIISDLTGLRRVAYKTEKVLSAELTKLCKGHDFTKRFEKAFVVAMKRKSKGQKKRARALALKIIKTLDGKDKVRRAELVQSLQAKNYSETEIEQLLKKLHSSGVISASVGRFSEVSIR